MNQKELFSHGSKKAPGHPADFKKGIILITLGGTDAYVCEKCGFEMKVIHL
ncbi:MAG: hypothetical protein OIN86_03885 [Candidatus Methanoperedens sp.]|nr:hypothetical protein [Candidatus Methanoperedens sp.]